MGARITRIVVGVAAVLGLVAGASTVTAQDKDTLVIALDTLGAQVMDPIADTRAPHAQPVIASTNQMNELTAYAASRSEVTLDMGKVARIDFAYTSVFFETVKSMQLASKRVILANLNELNAALLEAIGVNRYAILVRRKSS